jgi:N-acetylglutamate synthase-like GNAT family acetyltransferase
MTDISIRRASQDDTPSVTATVCEAYIHYIERIGKQPGPMLRDYSAVIQTDQVYVALSNERVIGTMTLKITADGFFLENVAVRPALQGAGVGRQLLKLAETEAQRAGHQSICLSTHELMTENRALYERIGYVEFDQRVINGYSRVFLRKSLV